jgi:ribonucleoside-triphosphate reductase
MYGAFGKRLDPDGDVDDLFKNGRATASLGYIGLYEVGTVFFGPDWEHNKRAKDFTVAVVKSLYDHCKQWEAEEGYHYSVYSTPSESLTDRFCRMDTEKFGVIPNITDKEYYTNSFHYDVRKTPTPFEKLDFEKDYPKYCSGGFIHYCEYPNLKQNPKALEAVWDFAYDRVGYLGTNTPIDQCFKCGFKGEFEATAKGFKCPDCGNTDPKTCDVVKRTCGYLGNPNQRPMVHGRHMEIVSRRKHMSFGNDQVAGGK